MKEILLASAFFCRQKICWVGSLVKLKIKQVLPYDVVMPSRDGIGTPYVVLIYEKQDHRHCQTFNLSI